MVASSRIVFVKVLASESEDIKIGIGDVYKNFRVCTNDPIAPDAYLYRELFTGDSKESDCLTWTTLSLDDIPLSISWEYVSDELMGMLR